LENFFLENWKKSEKNEKIAKNCKKKFKKFEIFLKKVSNFKKYCSE
jgi:hypothetical protein